MSDRVLILGGTGEVGSSVARDLLAYTSAQISVTGRTRTSDLAGQSQRVQAQTLDLDDRQALEKAIAAHKLVIHCAGPFRYRDTRVLKTCIQQGVNYVDISDDPKYVSNCWQLHDEAECAGITAILSSGVFPGISNSMAKMGIEQFDEPSSVHLRYAVAGSGGAGVTVMRTTFLELQHPFSAYIDGRWQQVKPYSERETVDFPQYGKVGVYWFPTIEAYTLPQIFPVQTVTSKFGSVPDLYNFLSWMVAQLPSKWLQDPQTIEFLSKASHQMTQFSDRWTGIGVAMVAEITGQHNGNPAQAIVSYSGDNTMTAVGQGTGAVAEYLLSGNLFPAGVFPVEAALPTANFQQAMQRRDVEISLHTNFANSRHEP